MTYAEIIDNNCKYHSAYVWWPRFAYHYTDIVNAIKIVKMHTLFSRVNAVNNSLMSNENANTNVISNTGDAVQYVRFYFRPLTPTQYRNEGLKHPDFPYQQGYNANVPVPVFFLFDLRRMCENTEGIVFSEMGQAGHGSSRYTGIDEFSRFNFDMIYSTGPMSNPDLEKKYRHAEILVPDKFDIDTCLSHIICRSESEKKTFLNLLRDESRDTFLKYKDKVSIVKSEGLFYKNGFAIEDCIYTGRDIVISLMGTHSKNRYTDTYRGESALRKLDASAQISWILKDSSRIQFCKQFQMDYNQPLYYTIADVFKPEGAKAICVKIWVENKMMCYMTQHLLDAAIM